jgi:hypothetical protein
MRAPLKPGGGVRKGTPYAAPERVFELLEPVREVLNADQDLTSLRMSIWMMAR